ncbi:serine hydrolase domain-containing protein [Nocardiopsis metallicus]|uniref:CubicO group peptidase (Beta-lactamase class C family) n=1 Tax=Nocardiopsis metallicus TaxID=179819 RepID=A0A840WAV8_9ACTN|nr:serine hydrolase domain-containing protein [Nocardiopsis metallicus]MBB5494180.1 CubicO group peptidase (beta-lactamase class C family) [Nocardiopsis metallicus]
MFSPLTHSTRTRSRPARPSWPASLGLSLALGMAAPLALMPSAPAQAQAIAPAPPLTPDTAQAFVDGRVPELLAEHGAPGLTVSIVADGEPLAGAAHGVADLADGTPMDEGSHALPTASIAKSFTAVAVLQLAEQGEVDLHEDVNTYLPEELRVPDTHPGEPVTLHHLLTHTPGFDERTDMDDPEDTAGQRDLAEFLRDNTPERIFPPGRYTAYSNYGTGLAGYVVQEVSGVPFEEYAERNVFAPLGMDGTEFGQLHELAQEHDLVTGHGPDGAPAALVHIPLVPAGAAVTSTGDMSRFMLALLNGGELDGERVLGTESVAMMLDRQFEHHPDATAMGYGTYEWRTGPPRGVGHGGDLDGIHTGYLLLPELDAGVFVAVNGDDTDPEAGAGLLHDLRFAVLQAFADEFGPADARTGSEAAPEADPGDDLSVYSGSYVTTRRAVEGTARIITLFDNLAVRDAGDGTLRVRGVMIPQERWLPVGDGVFVGQDSGERLVFTVEDGRAAAVYLDANPTNGYDRTSALAGPGLHLITVVVALLVLLTGTAHLRRPRGAAGVAAAVSASLTALACLVSVGLVVYAVTDMNRLQDWVFGDSVVLTMPLASAVPLALTTAGFAVTAWVRGWWGEGWWGRIRRVHYSLLPLAALAVIAVGVQYGLVWPQG